MECRACELNFCLIIKDFLAGLRGGWGDEGKCRTKDVHRIFMLTDANPDGNVPPASQIANKYDRDDISDLIAGGNQSRQTRWNVKALFYCRNHGVDVAGTQSLLECHKHRKKENKDL